LGQGSLEGAPIFCLVPISWWVLPPFNGQGSLLKERRFLACAHFLVGAPLFNGQGSLLKEHRFLSCAHFLVGAPPFLRGAAGLCGTILGGSATFFLFI